MPWLGPRPRSSASGEDAYPSVTRKAAAVLHSIANNHALVDGDKPLAWLATVVFLDLAGFSTDLSDDEAVDLVREVTSTPPTWEHSPSGCEQLDELSAADCGELHPQLRWLRPAQAGIPPDMCRTGGQPVPGLAGEQMRWVHIAQGSDEVSR